MRQYAASAFFVIDAGVLHRGVNVSLVAANDKILFINHLTAVLDTRVASSTDFVIEFQFKICNFFQ